MQKETILEENIHSNYKILQGLFSSQAPYGEDLFQDQNLKSSLTFVVVSKNVTSLFSNKYINYFILNKS